LLANMEEPGDQCKVVFAGLLLELVWKIGWGGGDWGASPHVQVASVKN